MGRERQKRKKRSGVAKAQRHKKSNKLVMRNPIIAANWDKTKTLSQNYKALGLATKLNGYSGGREPNRTAKDPAKTTDGDTLMIEPSVTTDRVAAVQEVRIERDPKTGAILRVLDDLETVVPKPNPLNDPLNEVLSDDEEDENMQDWHTLGRVPGSSKSGHKTAVVRELERAAADGVRAAPHTQSEREQDWMARLIAKHGDDYEAMFRDRKLNTMQQSVGDLKRRAMKWEKSHGLT